MHIHCIVRHSYQSVQCMRACVHVCVSSIVFKNPCQYLYLFWGITFSILMYLMCVRLRLCLFSAFSRRVGAL